MGNDLTWQPEPSPVLRAWLLDALARRAPQFPEAITEDTLLLDEGLCLDSLAVADLIAEIETTLGIRVVEAEVSAEHFETVGRLLRFLVSKGAHVESGRAPAVG